MFKTEKNLLRRLFENGPPSIGEHLPQLTSYALDNIQIDQDRYLARYPELKALPFDLAVHALLWGFIEGREEILAKGEQAYRNLQFFANSFHGMSHAYFFDKDYIATQLKAAQDSIDYLEAVCLYSERWLANAPINPNRYFNSDYTASLYGINTTSRQNSATLFLLGSQLKETIHGGGEFYKHIIQRSVEPKLALEQSNDKPQKLFFLSHGAGRTGACLNAFYTAAALRDLGFDVIFLYVQGGELETEIQSRLPAIKVDSPEHFSQILQELSCTQGIINTITLGDYVAIARQKNIPTVTLIHEWSTSVLSFGWSGSASKVASSATKIICSSQRGRADFLSAFPDSASKVHILPQGDYLGNSRSGYHEIPQIFPWLRERFSKIVIISGYFDTRKGFDLLPQLVVECNKISDQKYCFVHIGETAPHLMQWVQADLQKAGCDDQVYFLGKVTDPLSYFTHADAMALPSREDPLPTVVMEAVNSRLPVVLFDKSTGFTPLEQNAEFDAGMINQASYLDLPDFAAKLQVAVNVVRTKSQHLSFDFAEYISKLSDHISDTVLGAQIVEKAPREFAGVTAVVVFHNQARYAWVRLLSIAQQTVPPCQLIIVDDASTDNIQADLAYLVPVLKKRIPDVRVVHNVAANAGKNTIINIHHILDKVSQDWIWICEGDDFCMPDFLEKGIAHLDAKVSLYYSDSLICNDEGFVVGNYSEYYRALPTDQFAKDYRRNGRDECSDWLAVKNTIPNMSAVIVAKHRVQDLPIEKYGSAFGCGDWRFYRDILSAGDIAFNHECLNFHRRHERSVFGNNSNRNKNERELIDFQVEMINEGDIFPCIQDLIIQEMKNRPAVGIEADARKTFFLAKLSSAKKTKPGACDNEGLLIVVPDFGAGGGQLVAVDVANEYARRDDVTVYLCAARGFFGPSRTVLRRIDPKVIVLNTDDVTRSNIEALNIRKVQSHVYWSDKFVFERELHKSASWCISVHGCYNDFMNREVAYRDFVPLNEIPKWFAAADFIQLCAHKHFKAIQHFSPTSLSKAELIWNGLASHAVQKQIGKSNLLEIIDSKNSAIHLVMTGRWEPSKGWKLLRDAYSRLKAKNHAKLGKCYLIGPSGSELALAWGTDWNDRGDFVVTGELSEPAAAYGSATLIGILPSYFHSESQPRVVSEFFSKGIPVVTSEAGDLKQIVGSSGDMPGGVAVPISGPDHDPAALIDALNEVLKNYQKYRDGAKLRYERHLDIRKSVEKIEQSWSARQSKGKYSLRN